jgi:cystathionine gamma-synthase
MTEVGRSTLAVWGGEENRGGWGSATQTPVVHSASYGYPDLDHWLEVALGRRPGYIYTRNDNPTVRVFEDKVARLEGAPAAIAFASGMAAISGTLFALLRPGERVVSVKDTYGGTSRIFGEFLPRFGIEACLCDTADHDAVEREVSRGCRLLYLESPTNPTLKVLDIARLAEAGKAAGATVVVDNTFATPINTRPLALGADLVVHSATKFLGGHEDAVGGVACGRSDLVGALHHDREILGACLDPGAAYLLLRGMKTLELRVRRQNESALRVARFLAGHPGVESVNYPGLDSSPGHAIAARQMAGFGGVLSFAPRTDRAGLARLLKALRFAHCAASLGGVQTFAGPPATTSHVECTPEERAALGIPENLVRYSVGIEDAEDLIEDLRRGLEAAAGPRS